MNLTCGRNPWKRASPEDSTFREFLKDPKFLRTILPISIELDCILRRVFESDPQKRISLQELRDLIVACPQLTTSYTALPPSPPPSPCNYTDTLECANYALPPSPPITPPPQRYPAPYSTWSVLDASTKQTSICSTSSCDSGYHSEASCRGDNPVCFPEFHYYGNAVPYFHLAGKPFPQQQLIIPPVISTC